MISGADTAFILAAAGLVLLTASRPTAAQSRCEACAASRMRTPTFAIFSAIVDITCARRLGFAAFYLLVCH